MQGHGHRHRRTRPRPRRRRYPKCSTYECEGNIKIDLGSGSQKLKKHGPRKGTSVKVEKVDWNSQA